MALMTGRTSSREGAAAVRPIWEFSVVAAVRGRDWSELTTADALLPALGGTAWMTAVGRGGHVHTKVLTAADRGRARRAVDRHEPGVARRRRRGRGGGAAGDGGSQRGGV